MSSGIPLILGVKVVHMKLQGLEHNYNYAARFCERHYKCFLLTFSRCNYIYNILHMLYVAKQLIAIQTCGTACHVLNPDNRLTFLNGF